MILCKQHFCCVLISQNSYSNMNLNQEQKKQSLPNIYKIQHVVHNKYKDGNGEEK